MKRLRNRPEKRKKSLRINYIFTISSMTRPKTAPITVISGRLPGRPITRTGRLLHTAKKKANGLPAPVDNPHVVIQLLGGENVILR